MQAGLSPMFPLLRYFSLASFLALTLVAIIIVLMNRALAFAQLEERGEITNVTLTQVFGNSMWPRFRDYVATSSRLDAEALRSRHETVELRETIEALIHDLPILKVKIYNLDGLTVYSTDESEIGEDRSDDPGFLIAAREHRPASMLARRGTTTFSGAILDLDVIESYVPVHVFQPDDHAEIDAVFEFYTDVTSLIEQIDAAQRKLLFSIVVIFGLLYGVLFLIVRRAGRIIDQQYDEILAGHHAVQREKQAAEEASRAKSEFLANMSHEIRTPMTSILGFTDLLAEETSSRTASSRELDAIATIQRNGEHLLEIINEILDLSKIEAGHLESELEAFSPAALTEQVVVSMRPRAQERGLSLEFEIESSVPVAVESDPTRIRQILINLVSNALKFTEEGRVRVTVRHSGRAGNPRLSFEVSDTGIGMSSREIAGVFEPFVQSDSSASRKYQGTGLGLTICERLTSMLGGTIDVKSELGKGSTFLVSIPIVEVDRGRLKASGGVHSDPSSERDDHGRAPLPRLPSGCRVLIAEDGRDNQRLIADTLQRAGADIEFAEDGALAIKKVRAAEEQHHPFDVILMDMQMPVLDGYRAVKQLREGGYRRPIIALTAHAMPGDRQKCLDAGCDAYAAKPIDRRQLIKLIAGCCARCEDELPDDHSN